MPRLPRKCRSSNHRNPHAAKAAKEVIGGWAILDVDSKAEAVRIATEFMELHRDHWPGFEGESEVRPMFDPGMGP